VTTSRQSAPASYETVGLKLLMDAKGNLHDRGEEKLYHKGRVTTRVPYKS
jgi:hypothetical protein